MEIWQFAIGVALTFLIAFFVGWVWGVSSSVEQEQSEDAAWWAAHKQRMDEQDRRFQAIIDRAEGRLNQVPHGQVKSSS